uniref:Uncharacterized protein n=1 Tax=Panagrolaimus superbus TaxID=310955 RepID=A0A914YSZ1_9BILA
MDELDVQVGIVESYRMGKVKENDPSKPRLMKVKLQTSGQAKSIMLNAKKLATSTSFKGKGIILRPSKSEEQRKKDDQRFFAMKERIKELKMQNPGTSYCVYADQICLKPAPQSNEKPKPIDDPLNSNKAPSQLSGSNQEPMGPRRSFQQQMQ